MTRRDQKAPSAWVIYLLALFLTVPAQALAVADDHRSLILWYRNYDNPAIRSLVELALTKTPEYGSYELVRSEELSQGRALKELANNHNRLVDIANVATSAEREAFLNPIPLPVDGGLLGFRVCLVLPKNLTLFEDITNIDELKAKDIRIGQGTHWPDTPILEANGISVITHTRYEILFGMLRNERFECFARGIGEVLYDIEFNQADDLVIEPNLLIAYPMPSYLFVAPNDQETAHRLQLGMERAIQDGSFAVYLKTWFGRAVTELGLERRRILTLENPYLSEESLYIGRHTLENLRRRLEFLSQ
ncbi:transporter substrate-binding domain-containing protein [Marinobacter sp.]|uniref:transporter substrate-binding domain-containing protein n=1 Tax=Marinobacter sp. TaxID=50741 RepID=UPI0019F528CB|nr:transporter substrate-binding domain-containing protein [Marinobacter sp.]MBE0484894.1 transporter substrate-binding domain-containing protein [Marinobacter sp.]